MKANSLYGLAVQALASAAAALPVIFHPPAPMLPHRTNTMNPLPLLRRAGRSVYLNVVSRLQDVRVLPTLVSALALAAMCFCAPMTASAAPSIQILKPINVFVSVPQLAPNGYSFFYLPMPLGRLPSTAGQMRWTMINVCPKQGQADSHLLEFSNGTVVMIDVGEGYDASGELMKYLAKAGIRRIDTVVLTHMHADHYGKLVDLIKSGIKVGRVALNLPGSRQLADDEAPWGCNWDDVQATLKFLNSRGIPYWTPKAGERLVSISSAGVQSSLEVVCGYDGVNSPVGRTDVNDTSLILRLKHGATTALFTGDLNSALGTWLATSGVNLKADLLKVPHHGTEGLAPNSFFDKVAPKAAFVPSPKDLWYSTRSSRTRTYFTSKKIPTYVSGINGSVRVTMTATGYSIATNVSP
jgi:beta-lactamase superfamily II metal-dependent hydrolase